MSLPARAASFPLVLLLSFAGCAHSTWETIDPATEPGLPEYPDAQEVVLLEEQVVQFRIDEETGKAISDTTYRLRRRFLTPDAERPERVMAQYNRTFSKVLSFRGRVIRPDGTSEELDAARRIDAPAYTGNLLDDARIVSLPVPTLSPGSILEEEQVIRGTELMLSAMSWRFGGDVPVTRSRLTIVAPENWEVEWAAKTPTQPWAPTVTHHDGQVSLTWELTQLPPFRGEPGGDSESLFPWVRARLKSWREAGAEQRAPSDAREVSAWMYELSQGTDVASPALAATVKKLVAEAGPDPRHRAERLHRFVCEQVAYCSVQLGYGGLTPALASDVFEARYGDCKGKANLLRTMLRLAGIQSRLALVHLHDGFPRPFEPVSAAANFNHMIVQVQLPEGPLLVDPTATTVPFGVLPPGEIDADVLPIAEGGADLIHSLDPEPDASLNHLVLELRHSAEGPLRGTFRWTLNGNSAAGLRAVLLGTSGPSRERALTTLLALDGAHLEDVKLQGTQRGASTLEVSGRIALAGALRSNGAAAVFRLSSLGPLGLPSLIGSTQQRRTPFALAFRAHRVVDLSLALPPQVAPSELPPSVTREGRSIRYSLNWSVEEHKLEVHRELTWTRRITPAEEFDELLAFVAEAERADSRAIVLRTATPMIEGNR